MSVISVLFIVIGVGVFAYSWGQRQAWKQAHLLYSTLPRARPPDDYLEEKD